MITKTITDQRLIFGIFKEAEQLSARIVIAESESTSSLKLSKLEELSGLIDVIELSEASSLPDRIGISFWLGSDFFQSVLIRHSGRLFQFPRELSAPNRRGAARIDADQISNVPIIAVVSLFTRKIYGSLVNLSQNHISILVDEHLNDSEVSGTGTLTIHHQGNLIGTHSVSALRVQSANKGPSQLTLKVQSNGAQGDRASLRGDLIEGIALSLHWPEIDGFSTVVQIEEVSGLGMSGQLRDPGSDIFPLGTVFEERASNARLRLAWKHGSRLGFSFDTADPGSREKLHEFLLRHTDLGVMGSKRAESKAALSILTRAGLLKGERALSFSDRSKREIFNSRLSSKRWFLQMTSQTSNLSYLRISDDGWLIQELGSASDTRGIGTELLIQGLDTFYKSLLEDLSPSTAVLGIFDSSSKFNLQFWKGTLLKRLAEPPTYYPVTIAQLKGRRLVQQRSPKGSIIRRASVRNWLQHAPATAPNHLECVFNVFGISNRDYRCAHLAGSLQIDYRRLDREVHIVVGPDEDVDGYVVRLGLPPLSNATSLADNLYLFPRLGRERRFLAAVFNRTSQLLNGIEDVCIFSENESHLESLRSLVDGVQPRSFEAVVIPLRCIKESGGGSAQK